MPDNTILYSDATVRSIQQIRNSNHPFDRYWNHLQPLVGFTAIRRGAIVSSPGTKTSQRGGSGSPSVVVTSTATTLNCSTCISDQSGCCPPQLPHLLQWHEPRHTSPHGMRKRPWLPRPIHRPIALAIQTLPSLQINYDLNEMVPAQQDLSNLQGKNYEIHSCCIKELEKLDLKSYAFCVICLEITLPLEKQPFFCSGC